MENTPVQREEEKKKGGAVKRFFKAVFVHNFWAKVASLLIAAALWVLVVGLA